MGIKKKRSFTLIEMIIVIGVLGFALPILFAIMFLIIRQQGRIYSLMQIKKEGDFAFNSMKSTIRQNARLVTNPSVYPSTEYPTIYKVSLYPTYNPCPVMPDATPTSAPFLFLYDKSNKAFSYELKNNKIASNSAASGITDDYLTTDNVTISNMQFSCYRTSEFSLPIVKVNFRVTKSGTDSNPAFLDYSSRFQIKSY